MKILVLSQTRSGTHLLLGALVGSRQFYHFNPDVAFTPGALPSALRDFFANNPSEVTVVHHHLIEIEPDSTEWIKSWHELRSIFDRVVVLTRTNQLKQFLSKVIAEYRDSTEGAAYEHWNCYARRPTDPQVILDYDHYTFFKNNLRSSNGKILKMVYPYYEVVYESLVANWESVLKGVYEYLNFEWDDPKPITFRQESREIQYIISNWAELPEEQKLQLLLDDSGVQ